MIKRQLKLAQWLDILASTVKDLKEFEGVEVDGYTYEICPHCQHGEYNKPYIQLYNGLRNIAETLELNLEVREDYSDTTRLLQIEWDGVDFIQLEDKEDDNTGND